MFMTKSTQEFQEIYSKANAEDLKFKSPEGLTEEVVRQISKDKNEPEWMLNKRLEALKIFNSKPIPTWGPNLGNLNLEKIYYYMRPNAKTNSRSWDDVPKDIKETFNRLGIPEAEKNALGGVGAQYESETIYHNLKKSLEEKGVIFSDCDTALKENEELMKKYFMTTCISPNLHKFAALHAAVWSGGTFIYIPKNVKIEIPLQAYFRMNSKKGGQFEHTLIIADEGSELHYIEGCFTKNNLILTSEGYKKMNEIKNGELVLTSEGDFKKIKQIQKRPYSGNLYTLEFYGDSTQKIEVTEDHEFLYVDKKRNNERNKIFDPRWNTPKFFKKGDYLAVPINKTIKHKERRIFEVKYKNKIEKLSVPMIPEFFRLIGYYLAEGSTINEHYLCFDFNSKEREYIEDTKKLLKEIFKVDAYEQDHKTNNGTSVRVNSTKLARLFKQFGDRNYNKKLPKWVLFENRENQKEIINGWFKGGGNYYNKKHKSGIKEIFRINTTSEILTKQGRDLLLRLGIVSFINKRNRLKENRRIMFTLGVTGNFMQDFGKIVGIEVNKKMNNKNRASMFGINEKFAFFPIKKITKKVVKDISTFNFSVEDHETYTVAGVAVHNCSAPEYKENSLHAGGVEIHVLKGARVRYSSIENWSKNTYNLNTKRAIVHEDGIIEWVNGNLGCLTGESKIFSSKGPIEIQSLEVGNKIYVWNKKTNKIDKSRIKNKIFSGNKRVYKLEAGGREIETSSNHPFLNLVRKKNKKEHKKGFFYTEWKPLEQLKVGDIIGISKKIPIEGKPYILPRIEVGYKTESKNQYSKFVMNTSYLYNKKISIPNETNENFMWLMGLIMGDGHIDSKNNKINIATHITEDYRNKLIKIIKDLFGYKVTEKKERYIIINSKILCQLFTKIGFSRNAGTEKVPKWVFTLPEKQILSFLAGYFDSDGHVEKGGIYFTSINKPLLEQIKLLGIQTGFGVSKVFVHGKAKEKTILGKKTYAKDSWRILFNSKKIKELPSKCKRKKEKIMKTKTRRKDSSSGGLNFKSKTNEEIGFVRIKRIEEIGIRPTYDLEIENHHNFIANGFIVHNSKLTMLYPASVLKGKNAKSDYIGIAYAGKDQYQDTGCKVYHLNENTSSTVLSKGISVDGGISSYRGLVKINKGAVNSKSSVRCDGLMLDNKSKAMTLPAMDVHEDQVEVSHEAAVGKIGEEDLFYLMSRGLSESEATKLIVAGFIEPVVKALPLEYAVELNKLIELEIENSVC